MLIDYAGIIKNQITMQEICRAYGLEIDRSNKVICPFHNDTHNSLHIYKNSYYCFTCGAHGDIITFVQEYFKISFKDAICVLNNDFNIGLSIGQKINKQKQEKFELQTALLKAKKEYTLRKVENLQQSYDNALRQYIENDKILLDNRLIDFENITEEYANALKKKEYINYKLDCALFDLSIAKREE